MHAIFVRRAFYHLTAALFIVLALISVSSGQSAGISPASAVGATKDFSLSIEPKSVVDFSDQQLDETYARMSSQYSKNAVSSTISELPIITARPMTSPKLRSSEPLCSTIIRLF